MDWSPHLEGQRLEFPCLIGRSSATLAMAGEDVVDRVAECLQQRSGVVVLSGAGMSTAAGIPDFRSAGGLYGSSTKLVDSFTYTGSEQEKQAQRREVTRDVKACLTYHLFHRNPVAYHEMRRGMIIGLGENQWKCTLGHVFPEVLHRNGKLRLLASQNIDGLDHKIMSDPSKLYNPHGLMSILVAEPSHSPPLAVGVHDPVYQKYVELVKDNIKDIYADRPMRQGNSSRWPSKCGDQSIPITLDMFGDMLPASFKKQRDRENEAKAQGKLRYSVKPASVLFDGYLWTTRTDGSPCDWDAEASDCDLMMVMGTSLSGLTIDNMAHTAAGQGKNIVVFDMTPAPVQSIGYGWKEDKHFFLQGSIDENVLKVLHRMGWLEQLLADTYLPHLCLGSLNSLRTFLEANGGSDESLATVGDAMDAETEREKQLYGEE